jgi:hypothetical protein
MTGHVPFLLTRNVVMNRLKLAAAIIATVTILFSSPFLWAWWQDLSYEHETQQALTGEIAFVEVQPNADWPKQRITDPKIIDELRSWLLAAREDSELRSAPPGCVCEMRFIFRDGREEVVRHSPFRERLDGQRCSDCRDDVRLEFRGRYRSGETAELTVILESEP